MAHSHSTQRFIPKTLNRENLSYIHYIEFHHSLYNIYNVFRYSIDTKTLIPKTEIIFSKPLKIAKSAKNSKNCSCRIWRTHTHTHVKNITHTQQFNTFLTSFSHAIHACLSSFEIIVVELISKYGMSLGK